MHPCCYSPCCACRMPTIAPSAAVPVIAGVVRLQCASSYQAATSYAGWVSAHQAAAAASFCYLPERSGQAASWQSSGCCPTMNQHSDRCNSAVRSAGFSQHNRCGQGSQTGSCKKVAASVCAVIMGTYDAAFTFDIVVTLWVCSRLRCGSPWYRGFPHDCRMSPNSFGLL
jgi:hypothetical protein